ncbi:MAG: Ppx/GppA phosphatase family protein [Bacillota bacterium]
MKKLAVIDIGSNSLRLLKADLKERRIVSREKIKRTTRLGKGVDATKKLNKESINKSIDTIKFFYDNLINDNYKLIKIIGTSALRDANNSLDFIKKVENIAKTKVEIISGKKEAEYGFLGATFDKSKRDSFVIDIGGGSTEIIYGNKKIDILDSLDIGAVRLTDKCISTDPIKDKDLKYIKSEIDINLKKFFKDKKYKKKSQVIGIGGTITTLASIDLEMKSYKPEKINNYILKKSSINNQIEKFINCDLKQRKKIIGLEENRADIILAGSLILKTFLDYLNQNEIIISDYDNLEGIIYKDFLNN